ncbi:helicase-associated domain-containing protein [Streptomyces sp. NPDC086182]|uniref:helicase-associated domain-containing protein n=1 Tax=Streptomyces sp. NPDC086182 TaxID=3155058 RepID=UPI00342FA305
MALTKPAHDTLALLWRRWLSRGVIDEFSRVEAIKGQRAANVLTAVKPRRAQVGAALAACAPGEWTDVDTLFRTMRKAGHDPRIARSERALWKLYLEDPEHGSLGYVGFHNWELLQGRYTLAVLFEYAAVLGLVDVEYRPPVGARDDYRDNWGADWTECISRYDGLLALRLNPLGACATGQTTTYLPAPADTAPKSTGGLKVLSNHDVVALDGLAPAETLLLDDFAERTGDRVWALTSASLLAAADTGRDLAELRHHLNAATTVPLPQTVTTLLADAARRVGQVRDTGPVHLIECADPAVAALLATDRRTRTHCTRLGELHLAVPLDRLPTFRKAALAQGYPVA